MATTRARTRLYFTYPLTSGYDTMLLQQPSLFLQELPEELFETVQLRAPLRSSVSHEDDSIIIFDDLGEPLKKQMPVGQSFLRRVDELL